MHCMTHCIMQYIHISWPSLDFACSSISVCGWKLTCGVVWGMYGSNLSSLGTGTDRLEVHRSTRFWQPTSQISCIHPSCQPAHLHILSRKDQKRKDCEIFQNIFFSLPWNPDDFGSFLPFRTHGRCFDRGVGKRQRPEVFSGRERPFLRCGSLLRLSDHGIVWCTMRT